MASFSLRFFRENKQTLGFSGVKCYISLAVVFSVKYALFIGFSNENMGFLGCFKLYCRWVYQCILIIKQLLSSFQQKVFAKNITDKAILRNVIKDTMLFWVTLSSILSPSRQSTVAVCEWSFWLPSSTYMDIQRCPRWALLTSYPSLQSYLCYLPHTFPCRHAICFSLYLNKIKWLFYL